MVALCLNEWLGKEQTINLIAAKLYVGALNTLATALNLKPKHTEGIMLLGSE